MRPRYIVKSTIGMLLFAFFTLTNAFVLEPKLIGAVATAERERDIPVEILVIAVLLTSGMLFFLVRVTLEIRYVLRRQALIAATVYLGITLGAGVIGYTARMAFVPPQGLPRRAFSPSAYTVREGLIASILLAATGAIFTTANSIAFQRKADYTEFRTRRDDLRTYIAELGERIVRGQILTASDAARAAEKCTLALAALEKGASGDDPRYREFVWTQVRPPLTKLCEFISDPEVVHAPHLLPRGCGIIARGPLAPERVARLAAAYQTLGEV
jgi:hypothetical protein